MRQLTRIASDLHRQRDWPAPASNAQRNGSPGHGQDRRLRAQRSPDHACAPITPPPAAHEPQPPSDHQEVVMNPIRHSHLIRRVARLLAGLTALLRSITTGPAALAAQLRPDPPAWLGRLAARLHFPPASAGWDKHPPLPGQAHGHGALTGGMAGWQITLIVGATTVLAAVLAVIARRMRAGRRRATATTVGAMTTSSAVPRGLSRGSETAAPAPAQPTRRSP